MKDEGIVRQLADRLVGNQARGLAAANRRGGTSTRRIAMKTEHISTRLIATARIACAALLVLAVSVAEARAQRYVTGSANVDGFSLVGYVHQLGGGSGAGHFMIVVHRDTPENGFAAAVCEYTKFTHVAIVAGFAQFRSVGACLGLTTAGGLIAFTSDNAFGIVDNGDPGPGVDAVDVNFRGPSGVAVPANQLVNGNFIVRP
jgi:hypothetical protein